MKIKYLGILVIFVFGFILTACAKSTPTAASTDAAVSSGSTAVTTTLDGKSILEAKCQSCHGLAVVYGQQQSADGWTRVVDNMINRGAVLTADERTALIAYLAATYK